MGAGKRVLAMTRGLLGAVLAATLVAGCSSGHTIAGTFVLTDAGVAYSATDCSGTGGYSDIKAGTGVVLKDGAGKTIGTSNLVNDVSSSAAGKCAYTFTVEAPYADFYAVAVGHRGELTYSNAEMTARGWAVGFTLGE